MVKTELELPGSVKEFLAFGGKGVVSYVRMKGGRHLKVSMELVPCYDCEGNPIPEGATHCPACGLRVYL